MEMTSTCPCNIPNKVFITDPLGNTGLGAPHEDFDLINDKLHHKTLESGLYVTPGSTPADQTIRLCPDQNRHFHISQNSVDIMRTKERITPKTYNLCTDTPAKLTKEITEICMRLSNHAKIAIKIVDPSISCPMCKGTRVEHLSLIHISEPTRPL